MVSKIKNDNLVKLRVLADELCQHDFTKGMDEDMYRKTIAEIKSIVETSDESVLNEKSRYKKLKCYETMCSKIKIILSKLKN